MKIIKEKKLQESNIIDISEEQWLDEVKNQNFNYAILFIEGHEPSRTDFKNGVVKILYGGIALSGKDYLSEFTFKGKKYSKEYLSQSNLVYHYHGNGFEILIGIKK